MLYYGGIALAVATGLYSLYCPKPIKDHDTAFDLAQDECGYLTTMGRTGQYIDSVLEFETKCSSAEQRLFPAERPDIDTLRHVRGTPREREYIATLIVYAWRVHNIRRPRLRPVILVTFAVGFALIAIPAAVTFLQVSLVGLRALFGG